MKNNEQEISIIQENLKGIKKSYNTQESIIPDKSLTIGQC